ncbi:T9SS type A sorting domain-containing protein [Crocinitomicaceae bacterium]|nr:T9SS type A sorting domain-containing protein [Crocinitomicaceae bacterium]
MKKLLLFITICISSVSFGQTIMPNKITYTENNLPYSTASCFNCPNEARQTVDNVVGLVNNDCRLAPGDFIIYDLEQPRALSEISFPYIYCFGCGFTLEDFKIETASSMLGPWVEVYSGISTTAPSFHPLNITKVSRYWKLTALTLQGTWSTINFPEINFHENPIISSSNNSSTLMNGECVTLTAAATGENYLWSTGETTQSITVCDAGLYTCQVTNISFTGNHDHVGSIYLSAYEADLTLTNSNPMGPNGEVYVIHQKDSLIYFGGDFNSVGIITGSIAKVSSSNASSSNDFPRINGTVNTIISDGSGGWYVGGEFTRIGKYPITNLAHINANNTVDIGFQPKPNGAVRTMKYVGSVLYVGGDFTEIGGLTNNYIAKLDRYTGNPLFWNAFCNGKINSLELYDNLILLGGEFTSVGGGSRNYLAALDTTFIQPTTWNPDPDGFVNILYLTANKLYIGGEFNTVGGVAKSKGAGFTLPNFSLDLYDFNANGRILAYNLFNNVLYVAGEFTQIGGANRNYIAAVNPLNAVANAFNPDADGIVRTINNTNTSIVVGGDFENIGGTLSNKIAKIDPLSGILQSWNCNLKGIKYTNSTVNVIAYNGLDFILGGFFHSINNVSRENIAAINYSNNSLSQFSPNPNGNVYAINSDNNAIYIGGDFSQLMSSINKNNIAQVNPLTGIPTGWNPNADGVVRAIEVDNTNLYVGGSFSNIGGASRINYANINAFSGAAQGYAPNPDGPIASFTLKGDTLLIGGEFSNFDGQIRNNICGVDLVNNTLLSLNPDADNKVSAVHHFENSLFFGGDFGLVSNNSRKGICEFDMSIQSLTNYFENSNEFMPHQILAIELTDSIILKGGAFSQPNGGPINSGYPVENLTAYNYTTNNYLNWQPNPDSTVCALKLLGNNVAIGGKFKELSRVYAPFFSIISAPPGLINCSNTSSVETVTECDTYTWNTNGQTYTQSGQYTEVLPNQNGCDSTVTLNLTITNSNTVTETVTECDSYTWNTNGQTYTQSGQYTQVLTNQSSCDSTIILNLTINSSSSSSQTVTELDSYTWPVNNETYTESGTYTAVIPNSVGCDSTITLNLTLESVGLDENESSYVAVYPNPTYKSFILSTKDMINMNYSLLDIQGKVVLTGKIESTEETVDISKLSKGQYNLVFEDESISPISIIKN